MTLEYLLVLDTEIEFVTNQNIDFLLFFIRFIVTEYAASTY